MQLLANSLSTVEHSKALNFNSSLLDSRHDNTFNLYLAFPGTLVDYERGAIGAAQSNAAIESLRSAKSRDMDHGRVDF